jgi:thioredoxin reductase (NADPH)
LRTLLIEIGLFGGQITTTEIIENYPGFPNGISGSDLALLMEEQAKRFGLETVNDEVLKVHIEGQKKVIKAYESEYEADTLIVASGAEYRKLGVPGEEAFIGKGVSFCATCDGAFFKESKIVVVGGGDSALTEALFLTKFAKEISIIHRRDALRGTKIYQERAMANPKIKFIWNSVLEEIKGDQMVKSIVLKNVKTNEVTQIETEGVFLFVGIAPRTQFIKDLVEMDEGGYILTDEKGQTSIPGVFAAGDCRKKLLRQVTTAVGDGAMAAFAAEKYLEEKR